MKNFITVLLILVMTACSQVDDLVIHNDISEFQGWWRDSIFANGELYIEDLVVIDNSIDYTLSNDNSRIVYDRLTGTIVLGNENKLEWNGISPIKNMIRKTYWEVQDVSTYQMKLYSNLLGQHVFHRVYRPSGEFEIKDTLREMTKYQKLLPIKKMEAAEKFGVFNRITSDSIMFYYLSHPLFSNIKFNENCENDSIYSYTISVKDWNMCKQIVNSQYTIIRDIKGKTEFCDAASLDKALYIIIADSAYNQFTFSPINDYDFWPNMSKYIGMNIQEVKRAYEDQYVYVFHQSDEDGLFEYQYQTRHDGLCEVMTMAADGDNIIRRCWVTILGKYSEAQKNTILHLLISKYPAYRKGDNETYYFYADSTTVGRSLEVKYEAMSKKITYNIIDF
jgi:hypothetical protein